MPFSTVQVARAWALCLVAVLAAGLRLQQLSIQWLTDDEWHALHTLLGGAGYADIASSFGHADYSIPLTLLYRLLLDTVGLSEWLMRLPALLAGLLFVALAIVWLRRHAPAAAVIAFGALLAMSPMLVNYSRMARPYMPGLLLAAVALLALERLARSDRRRDAIAYVLAAWLAGYLHALLAPFVLAPVGWLLLSHGWRHGWRSALASGRRLVVVGLVATALLLASILPPLLADTAAIASRAGKDLPTFATAWGMLHAWMGTSSAAVVLGGLVLAAVGCASLRTRFGALPAMWACGLLATVLAIAVLQPASIQHPLTLARYLLPGLPALLLLVALGMARLVQRLPPPGSALALVLLLGLACIGQPHAELLRRPNNFTLHSYHQLDFRPARNPVRHALRPLVEDSPFWARMAALPPSSQRIAIAGNPGFESIFNLQPFHQPVHRQRLLNLQTGPACGPQRHGEATPDQGVRLHNAVAANRQALLDARIDWVVFDRGADRRLREGVAMQAGPAYMSECIDVVSALLGPPDHVDENLVVFRVPFGASR